MQQLLIVVVLATTGHRVRISGTGGEGKLLEDLQIQILCYRSTKRL